MLPVGSLLTCMLLSDIGQTTPSECEHMAEHLGLEDPYANREKIEELDRMQRDLLKSENYNPNSASALLFEDQLNDGHDFMDVYYKYGSPQYAIYKPKPLENERNWKKRGFEFVPAGGWHTADSYQVSRSPDAGPSGKSRLFNKRTLSFLQDWEALRNRMNRGKRYQPWKRSAPRILRSNVIRQTNDMYDKFFNKRAPKTIFNEVTKNPTLDEMTKFFENQYHDQMKRGMQNPDENEHSSFLDYY